MLLTPAQAAAQNRRVLHTFSLTRPALPRPAVNTATDIRPSHYCSCLQDTAQQQSYALGCWPRQAEDGWAKDIVSI
ncbi:hypothetical protein JZ751_016470 [Albula glossodonta]|uniref:Uncharacterized protein n=1 Tax=Albula glossodonta TaxID=121402 RepID=A0A8T2NYE6_9TELE|nr:hypothetical protein JZ751_016470 [Albula glossodonta]